MTNNGVSQDTLSLRRLMARVSCPLERLGEEHLGQVVDGKGWQQEYHAWECPQRLNERQCTAQGDITGIYHGQVWVREEHCPYCLARDFVSLYAKIIPKTKGLLAIVCPVCKRAMECLARI